MFSVLEGGRLKKRERGRERQLVLIFKKKKSIPLINVENQRPKSVPLPSTVIKIEVFFKKKNVISDCKEAESLSLCLPHLLCLFLSLSLLRETWEQLRDIFLTPEFLRGHLSKAAEMTER